MTGKNNERGISTIQFSGDWTCPGCGVNCFASKTECFKCGSDKPGESGGHGRQDGGMKRHNGERGIPAELEYLAGGGAWRLAPRQVTSLMGKSNREPAGGWKASLQLFDAMSQHAPDTIDMHVYSAAITACEKGGGQCERAEDIFQAMIDRGVKPNVIVISSMISAMGKGGQWKRAEDIFKGMLTRQLEPNVITYNALITAMGRGDQWKRADELFQDMLDCGMQPDFITFSSLITSMGKGGQWERAVQIFKDMLTRGMKPDGAMYIAIFEALEGNKQSAKADALFRADQTHSHGAVKVMEQQQAARGVHKPCLSGFTKQRDHDLGIDLHGLSAKQACVVIRCCVKDLADMHGSGREVAIVLNAGGKSGSDPVVAPAVKSLLSDEMKMVYTAAPGNEGLLLLTL
jgi:pentatricopeptide repeat protein